MMRLDRCFALAILLCAMAGGVDGAAASGVVAQVTLPSEACSLGNGVLSSGGIVVRDAVSPCRTSMVASPLVVAGPLFAGGVQHAATGVVVPAAAVVVPAVPLAAVSVPVALSTVNLTRVRAISLRRAGRCRRVRVAGFGNRAVVRQRVVHVGSGARARRLSVGVRCIECP